VLDRFAAVEEVDSARIARAIEFTRFPYVSPTDETEGEQGIDEFGSLLRPADLIGQLGDPHYLSRPSTARRQSIIPYASLKACRS
jgi:hypothetical protein